MNARAIDRRGSLCLRRGGVLDESAARARRRPANETIAALERAGIATEKVADEGSTTAFTVRIARRDAGKALDLLRSLGLPRDRRHGFAEVYGQPSLIPTPSEERARYLEALGGEIERTLETADGVVSARVHLVLEENDPLGGRSPSRARRRAPRCCSRCAADARRCPKATCRSWWPAACPGWTRPRSRSW